MWQPSHWLVVVMGMCLGGGAIVDGVIFFFFFFALSRCSASSSSSERNGTSLIRHSEYNYTYLRPHQASSLFLIKSPESSTSPLPHQQKRGVWRGDMMVAVFDLIEGPCRDRSLGWCQNPSWLTVSSAGWQLEGFGD